MLAINNQYDVHTLSCQSACGHVENLTRALTDSSKFAIVAVHQAKWSGVWVGPHSVNRRLNRAISRGFSMVRRIGEPYGSPFPISGRTNPVRLTARSWSFFGQLLKLNNRRAA